MLPPNCREEFTVYYTKIYIFSIFSSLGLSLKTNPHIQVMFLLCSGFVDMLNRFVPSICDSFSSLLNWKIISGGQHHALALDKNGENNILCMLCL